MAAPRGTRTYDQHCGLAAALDVVATRWALLIVRDLAAGPRRFSDLLDGLPGISTDMLSSRLRALTDAGAVERDDVRDPVPGVVYRLTDRGRDLARIAGDLGRWGMPLLPPVEESPRRRNARWGLQSMASNYLGSEPAGLVHVVLDGEHDLTIDVTPERVRVRYGHLEGAAFARIESSSDDLLRTVVAVQRNGASFDPDFASGDLERLTELVRALPLRV